MRTLLWFTVGFSAACGALCLGWTVSPGLAAGILLPLLLISLLLRRKWEKTTALAPIVLGLLAGLLWTDCFSGTYLEPARQLDGTNRRVSISVHTVSRKTAHGATVDGQLYLEGKPYQVRLYLERDLQLRPGDRLTGSFRFRYTGEGGLQESGYHQGRAIFLVANQKGALQTERNADWSFRIMAMKLQKKLLDSLEAVFPADTLGFAKALLLGSTGDLRYETDVDFQISGIRHVIAVSGLHVSILFSVIFLASFGNRFTMPLLGFPVLALFASVAGLSPSVVRACIMQGLLILSILCNREYDAPTALAFAVLFMLVLNPMTLLSVSFQLSVGCLIGILAFAEPLCSWILDHKCMQYKKKRGRKSKFVHFLAGSLSITLSAAVVTTPLSVWHFGTVSLIGAATNLLTLWLIPFLFHGIFCACLLGLLWPAGGAAVAWLVSWGMRYVMGMAHLLADAPVSALYIRSGYLLLWLLFAYGLVAVHLLLRPRRPMVFTCCLTVGLCLALGASWLEPQLDDCRVTVLDVGQGQSVILQSEGKTFLVDCGGDYDRHAAQEAAKELRSQGLGRIDGLIVTHFDYDHVGGVPYLLSWIDCPRVYLPDTEKFLDIADKIREKGCPVEFVQDQIQISYGTTNMTIFPAILPDHGNESSLCVLFQPENYDILLTGDRGALGEKLLLAQTELPKLELLIAGHHGSASSTCEELLEATHPETVIISAGRDNPYGHPAPEVLARLSRYGCHIFRTDLQGTIIYRR